MQKAENERKARQAEHEREQQEKQAEKSRQEKQRADDLAFVQYFESLPQDEQGRILDEVYTRLGEKLGGLIERKTVHAHPMICYIFKQVMGV